MSKSNSKKEQILHRATFTTRNKKVVEITKLPVELIRDMELIIKFSGKDSFESFSKTLEDISNRYFSEGLPVHKYVIRKITPKGGLDRYELIKLK